MKKDDVPVFEDPVVRDQFDRQAQLIQRCFWDAQANEWNEERANQGMRAEYLDALAGLTGPVLLVGVGRGMILNALRDRGFRSTGIDWSEAMIDAARRDGVYGIEQADAGKLPFDAKSFGSVILSTGVLMPTHLSARTRRYLQEARRVVSRRGHVFLCVCYEEKSEAARVAARNVQLPIHTIHAQVFWELSTLEGMLPELGLKRVRHVQCDGVRILQLQCTRETPVRGI